MQNNSIMDSYMVERTIQMQYIL